MVEKRAGRMWMLCYKIEGLIIRMELCIVSGVFHGMGWDGMGTNSVAFWGSICEDGV